MDRKESFYWDVVKGTAIFLMLWGHCIQYCALYDVFYPEDVVYKTIYTFHMPLFMLVSGYLFFYSFQKRTMPELLEHRIRGMLHPIIMATFLNNILLQIPRYVLSNQVDFLFGSLFHGIESDLWFLWAVLYCSLIVGFFCKLTEKPGLQLVLTVFGAFVVLLFPQWNMTLFMYPYFVAGFFCGMFRKYAQQLYKILRYAALVVFPVMVMFYETKHYIYVTPMFSAELGLAESVKIALYRWAIGFVGSVCMLSVMDFLVWLGDSFPAVHNGLRRVSFLGRNSLQIYCLSASLLSGYLPHLNHKLVEVMGDNVFEENRIVYDFLFTPILAVMWSVFLSLVVVALKKSKLHQLVFGR